MTSIQPPSKPQALRDKIEAILKANNINLEAHPLVLVGIRGYYLDSMGAPGKNDRGIYDDALFWITQNSFVAFNGNTDPSRYKKGKGKGSQKGMACLNTGIWKYKTGMHNGVYKHAAFIQDADVVVTRDGIDGDYQDKGMFGINIHRGGSGTSSLGCQTLPVNQWDSFKAFGYAAVKNFNLKNFVYLLITEEQIRSGNLKLQQG